MKKSLFNYSLYSHPEIGNFQGVTKAHEDLNWSVREQYDGL
jgi:hypothetical protein